MLPTARDAQSHKDVAWLTTVSGLSICFQNAPHSLEYLCILNGSATDLIASISQYELHTPRRQCADHTSCDCVSHMQAWPHVNIGKCAPTLHPLPTPSPGTPLAKTQAEAPAGSS